MATIRKHKLAVPLIMLAFSVCFFFSDAAVADEDKANDPEIVKMCNDLFAALQSGDTVALKLLFDGDMLENNRLLLEQNEGYPNFLRNYYKGASFKINEAIPDGDAVLVGFTIDFPDGHSETQHLQMILRDNINARGYGDVVTPKNQRSRYGIFQQVNEVEFEKKRRKWQREMGRLEQGEEVAAAVSR